MIATNLEHIAQVVSGQLLGENRQISQVSTDTRTIGGNALFIALVGERFDAMKSNDCLGRVELPRAGCLNGIKRVFVGWSSSPYSASRCGRAA